MANIKVDGKLVEVPDYFTLMQAAEAAGAVIPRFCSHERLAVAGHAHRADVAGDGGADGDVCGGCPERWTCEIVTGLCTPPGDGPTGTREVESPR